MAQDSIPGDAVKLKGEEDVFREANLANKAALSAQVTVVNVVRGVLH